MSSLKLPGLFLTMALFFLFMFQNICNANGLQIKRDYAILSALTIFGYSASFGFRLVPTETCNWCSINQFDLAFSNAFRSNNVILARISSDVVAYGLSPLLMFGSILAHNNSSKIGRDILLIISSLSVATALTQLIKVSARRKRPEEYFGFSQKKRHKNRSFVSGHTSFVVSGLAAASTIALNRKALWAPYFVGLSAATGIFMGYARIAAAKHWMTDVLSGAALGLSVGVLIPLLFIQSDTDDKNRFTLHASLAKKSAFIDVGFIW